MANIKFGTDGWRAKTDEDFNDENVKLLTDAIAVYLLENFEKTKPVLIGYDTRYKADYYSNLTAKRLSEYGFKVMYSKTPLPTPVLAYGAKNLNSSAIMFTASHNPPEYLGIKFIPDYAGPASKEITDKIISAIGKKVNFEKNIPQKPLMYDFFPDYSEHLKKVIDFKKISKLKILIIYDGLYSASVGFLDKILSDVRINYKSIHTKPDPNFGGLMPDPKPQYLTELIKEVKSTPKSIGISTDGDADRFGIVNENGEFVSPNEIISILLKYLKEKKNLSGVLIKTVGGSLLLNKIAEKLKTEVIETAVGFKHVGEAMRKNKFIIGGEESGGLSIQGHIPEKDGLLADLLVLEAIADSNYQSLTGLQQELKNMVGIEFINDRIDLPLNNLSETEHFIEKFKSLSDNDIKGFSILKKDYKDGVKIYFTDEESWILVRASGTEPLLRVYMESTSDKKINSLKELIRKIVL